jgi:hypothetical protein
VENLRKSASSAGNLFILFHATWYYNPQGNKVGICRNTHQVSVPQLTPLLGAGFGIENQI